jgi:UDP-glucose 4-epimerase
VYSVNQLAAAVAKSMGKPLEVKYLKKRDEVLAAFCEHEKIKKYFPGRQNVSLSEGLGRMARWAYSVGPRKSTEFCDIEIWDNLPEGWSPSVNKG